MKGEPEKQEPRPFHRVRLETHIREAKVTDDQRQLIIEFWDGFAMLVGAEWLRTQAMRRKAI